jgi:peptidoglycan hydrolase-like protein with peptidoglycan-binding domain
MKGTGEVGSGTFGRPKTGFFGTITRGDVRDFQRRHNIAVDGIVGPVTWNTIIRGES